MKKWTCHCGRKNKVMEICPHWTGLTNKKMYELADKIREYAYECSPGINWEIKGNALYIAEQLIKNGDVK